MRKLLPEAWFCSRQLYWHAAQGSDTAETSQLPFSSPPGARVQGKASISVSSK